MNDRAILEHYPLPLARGYRRFRNASELRERHDAAYYLFEVYLKYVASIAIAHYLSGEGRDHRVNAALKGLARPSLGEWLRFLRECAQFLMQGETPDPLISSLAALLDAKEGGSGQVLSLYNRLREFRTGASSERDRTGLGMLLEEVVSYRNRVLAHGAPREKEHYRIFGELFAGAFPEVLERSGFLLARRLVSFDSLQVEGSAERSRIECGVIEYMSDRSIRRERPHVIPYGKSAPEKQLLYLLGEDGTLVSLDPLLVAHDEDVYVLNEVAGAPEYLSYATGARHRPASAGEAQERLFERILGYEVDAKRLSRIGQDLAPAPEAPAQGSPEEGARRLGDYRILKEIGRGAMGIVFEAVQESLGRRVALKVLPGNFALDQKRLERFRREARATARIHHPCIVPVYEVGEVGGNHYYAMEFIDGPSLERLLAQFREESREQNARGKRSGSSTSSDPATIARSVESLAELAEGLEQAHRLGLIHRDVKPSNVLVEKDGRYVLVDFGLVRETEAGTLTRSGEMVGTLSYMSPEQVSRSQVDARADVYALGATLYEVLTLRTPYLAESEHEVQRAILFEEPIAPRKINPRLHRDLETILLKALEKNPERRYASAGDFAADLRRFLRYEPIRARAQSAWTRITRRAAKYRLRIAAAAAIVVLLLITAFVVVRNRLEARTREIASYEPTVLKAAMEMQLAGLGIERGGGYLRVVDSHALHLRGNFKMLSRQVERAPIERSVERLGEAEAILPGRPDAHYHRARGLLLLERIEEAGGELESALACDRRFVPAWILRASLKERLGDVEGAKHDQEKARTSGEASWGEAWLRAHEAGANGRWQEAAESYGMLVRMERAGLEPYLGFFAEALIGRGVARLETENFREAVEDFLKAKALMPESPQIDLLLGKTYYFMAQVRKAEELFETLYARSDQKDEIALEVAALYFPWNSKGVQLLRWVDRIRDLPSIRERNRAMCLTDLGRNEEAVAAGLEALRLSPQDAFAYAILSDAYVMQGDVKRALELRREALLLAPGNAMVQGWAGGGFFLQLADKIKNLRRSIALDPYMAWAHVDLAESLFFSLREEVEAFAEIQEAIRLEPNYYKTYAILGRMQEGQGKLEQAVSSYCRSIELDPTELGLPHDRLYSLLRRKEMPVGIASRLEGLVERLEKLLYGGADDTKVILQTLALVLIHHPTAPEPGRALRYARRAVEESGRVDSELLATLAEVEWIAGEKAEAVLSLEEAVRLPDATRSQAAQLEEYRKALVPKLASFASIDAALDAPVRESLISEGGRWRYFPGRSDPSQGLGWTDPRFDDSSWPSGPSAYGYGAKDGLNTRLDDMRGSYSSVYLRRVFTIAEPSRYRRFLLSVKADDGFAAWLNQKEVGRVRAGKPGEPLAHAAVAEESAPDPLPSAEIWLEPSAFRPGENTIAIQGLNVSLAESSDLFLLPLLFGELPPDPERGPRLLGEIRDAGTAQSLERYLEGRILESQRKHREAAVKFTEAAGGEFPGFEPHLRLAGSLRAAGDPQAAEKALRQALEGTYSREKDLWNLWAVISFVDLRRAPADLLASLPLEAGKDSPAGDRADLRWLLERLKAGEPIRINCGGPEYASPAGVVWGCDRFYDGGHLAWDGRTSYGGEISGTEDDPLYRTERYFGPEDVAPARYRIPLPPGDWRVTLHFAEIASSEPGRRRFDVALEGIRVLEGYDPAAKAGFAAADKRSFPVRVDDGTLDIEFFARMEDPKVSALEIETAPR